MLTSIDEYARRLSKVRSAMVAQGVDTVLLSVGHDLPYLTGYTAMPLERLTMLVLHVDGVPLLFVPRLEAPRVAEMPELFEIVPWDETVEPLDLVAAACLGSSTIAIGDQTWARFVVGLSHRLPGVRWERAVGVVGDLRMRKSSAEVDALRAAAEAVDAIAAELQSGQIPLIGRTEAEVSADLSQRILARGHEKVNFAIVAAGENAASPHHHPGSRVIEADEVVLCDFGGTMNGYCSDITRCVVTGEIPSEVAAAYEVLMSAQSAGVAAGQIGVRCEEVDSTTRQIISDGGYGEYFVHRTGHGIGMEEHEDPYMVSGDVRLIEDGFAYSVEPGIYIPGKWGLRLEDIVVATPEGPRSLNQADHSLHAVSA
ncbi:MAG: aminopeptidase P family protein [Ilumatobacteraceae bacterium]|jgi:Xaa-Pro aminopeptidase|nr:aminopeptidase P family protein [Ilumatobacteraceae bacterium]